MTTAGRHTPIHLPRERKIGRGKFAKNKKAKNGMPMEINSTGEISALTAIGRARNAVMRPADWPFRVVRTAMKTAASSAVRSLGRERANPSASINSSAATKDQKISAKRLSAPSEEK